MIQRKLFNFITILFLLFFLTAFSLSASAAVPPEINYQGLLTDADGNPVNDVVEMTFSIYDAASGGTALWSETQPMVEVTNGIYHVQIGSVVAIPYDIIDADLYLGVTIEPDSEMIPRQKLTSVPFAMMAQDTDNFGGLPATDYIKQGELNAITTDMIQNGAVTTVDIQTDAVKSAEIDTDAVGESEIGTGAVRSDEVLDDSLTADDLAEDSVGQSELALNSVGSAEIIDGEVTAADIADGSGSNLNADALDGLDQSAFLRSNTSDTYSGSQLTIGATSDLLVEGDLRFGTNDRAQWAGGAESFGFDGTQSRFEITDDVFVEDTLEVDGNVYVSRNLYMESDPFAADGDQTIWFHDARAITREYFRWDDSESEFRVSDDLRANTFSPSSGATRYAMIAGNSFIPEPYTGQFGDEVWGMAEFGYGYMAQASSVPPGESIGKELFAPLVVPFSDIELTEFRCYVYDNDPAYDVLYAGELIKRGVSSSTINRLSSVGGETSGFSNAVISDVGTSISSSQRNFRNDGTNFLYLKFGFVPDAPDQDLRFYGCRVRYTVNEF